MNNNQGVSITAKIIAALRNTAACISFIIATYLVALATAYLPIFISDTTVYAGGKMPLYAMITGGPALLCVAGVYLRQFRRWRRDIGLVFLLGWLLYLPFMIAGRAVFLNQAKFPNVIKKYSDINVSFVEFSFISRIIWVLNLLLAIYLLRADRKALRTAK